MARLHGEPALAGLDRKEPSAKRHLVGPWRLSLVAGAVLQAACPAAGAADSAESVASRSPASLARLSIEELSQIEISSVSKRPERLADAAASVYVITREDIRRCGATTLPEVLRLAPNLQVARSSSNGYAISARGFNDDNANKLLVMIDGRTVYTPLHSGVFWDVQDVLIGDIERIEVVSGPGGTLWGANAVNGVINVITLSAKNTIGLLTAAIAGSNERGLAARDGVALGDEGAVRLYAKSFRFDHNRRADGTDINDAWNRQQAGFRADWGKTSNWTLQGDLYQGDAQALSRPQRNTSGANLLARWSREYEDKSGLQFQAYFDTYKRRQEGFFTEDLDTIDIDAQHHFQLGSAHEIVWGGGVREQRDKTSATAAFGFFPAESKLTLANLFAQDTWTIQPRTKLTLGLKLEHNSYTGLEYQPNVRIAWKPAQQSLLWAALSRAVRTPSRLDRGLMVFGQPGMPSLLGGPDFKSERLTAYELGYRGQPRSDLSYSVSTFVNFYDRLRSVEPNGSGDFVLGNGVKARTEGIEAWGGFQVHEGWRVNAGLLLQHQSFSFAPDSQGTGSASAGSNDPKHQFTLRSSWSLPRDISLDLALRSVAALPSPAVPGYTTLDARLAWPISKSFELSFSGFNLLGRHAEFGAAPARAEYERSFALRLLWAL